MNLLRSKKYSFHKDNNMNETFSLRRFRLVFIKTIVERPMQIVGTFALSFSVVLLIYFLIKSISPISKWPNFLVSLSALSAVDVFLAL